MIEGVLAVETGIPPRSMLNREGQAPLAPRNLPSAQVCLTHVDGCTSEPTAKAKKNLAPVEVLEEGFEGDTRLWTVAGLRTFNMYRLISDRVKPLQLGEPGRQKVRKSCDVFVPFVHGRRECASVFSWTSQTGALTEYCRRIESCTLSLHVLTFFVFLRHAGATFLNMVLGNRSGTWSRRCSASSSVRRPTPSI